MKLTSPAFENCEHIPKEHTCDGYSLSPSLEIEDVPKGTRSLVLIVDDPDAVGGTFTHWIVWNIGVNIEKFKKNHVPDGAVVGINSDGKNDYAGPCPPTGTHVYLFKLYAIDICLPGDTALGKKEVRGMIEGHIIEKTTLKGYYERHNGTNF